MHVIPPPHLLKQITASRRPPLSRSQELSSAAFPSEAPRRLQQAAVDRINGLIKRCADDHLARMESATRSLESIGSRIELNSAVSEFERSSRLFLRDARKIIADCENIEDGTRRRVAVKLRQFLDFRRACCQAFHTNTPKLLAGLAEQEQAAYLRSAVATPAAIREELQAASHRTHLELIASKERLDFASRGQGDLERTVIDMAKRRGPVSREPFTVTAVGGTSIILDEQSDGYYLHLVPTERRGADYPHSPSVTVRLGSLAAGTMEAENRARDIARSLDGIEVFGSGSRLAASSVLPALTRHGKVVALRNLCIERDSLVGTELDALLENVTFINSNLLAVSASRAAFNIGSWFTDCRAAALDLSQALVERADGRYGRLYRESELFIRSFGARLLGGLRRAISLFSGRAGEQANSDFDDPERVLTMLQNDRALAAEGLLRQGRGPDSLVLHFDGGKVELSKNGGQLGVRVYQRVDDRYAEVEQAAFTGRAWQAAQYALEVCRLNRVREEAPFQTGLPKETTQIIAADPRILRIRRLHLATDAGLSPVALAAA